MRWKSGGSPFFQARSLSAWEIGAGDGDRTRDIQLGKLAFYR
jgi:hypothetical protein